jgi:DNA polymerase elongation subunit (family B)
MKILEIPLDIETIPGQPEEAIKAGIEVSPPGSMSKPETIKEWHNGIGKYAGVKDALIEEQYRKTSFNGGIGQIANIAWSYGTNERNKIYSTGGPDMSEADLLNDFFSAVQNALELEKADKPFFIGHNIANFDLKFIKHRAIVLGIKPPFELPFSGRHGKDYFCTMQEWCGYRDMVSMDKLCGYLGIPGKGDIDGSQVWDLVKARMFKELDEYNKDDVRKVIEIYRRQTFGA